MNDLWHVTTTEHGGDSISDGLSVVAPGRAKDQGTLAGATLENVRVVRQGFGVADRHAPRIRADVAGALALKDCLFTDVQNDSPAFLPRVE